MNKELVLWAKYDVERAIPSVVDGLKPGQRKVLYSAFLKKLTQENGIRLSLVKQKNFCSNGLEVVFLC